MNTIVPIDKEYIFEGSSIISQTDLQGVITFANRKFCEISGYSKDELIGKQHSIIRHPNMPHVVFEELWNTISSGHSWNGLMKNLRKDGLYYWVDTEILPIQNEKNELTGFIAVRRVASRKNIQESETTYKKMYEL